MRFAFDPEENIRRLIDRLGKQAFLVNYEGKVLPGQQLIVQENQISIRKADDRSARLFFPWPISGKGDVLFSTGSLIEREEPYSLLVELARGKISSLRNQSGSWQQVGMTIPLEFYDRLDDAHDFLARGVQTNDDAREACRLGGAALEQAQLASDVLMASFIEQRMKLQSRRYQKPPLRYCCGVDFHLQQDDSLAEWIHCFDEVSLPLNWKMSEESESKLLEDQIETSLELLRQHNLNISAGPLLDFSDAGLPGWIKQWERDVISMQSLVCDFVETTVSRYANRIRKWDLAIHGEMGAAGENWAFLTEEVRLRLLSRSLEILNQIDNQLEVSLLITDPWGLYHGEGGYVLTPFGFVDILTRARGRLSSLKLVLTNSYEPNRTPPFDWLELSRLIDYWSALTIPLQVVLAAPSSGDFLSQASEQVDSAESHLVSQKLQSEWYEKVISLLIAKESVVGVQFEHFHDKAPHRYASAGFVDVTGKPKISLERLPRLQTFDWKP
ncbi:MAG: hypothetical protein KDA65_02940 [Planctomycetaceae bacterium]|nr:hypothetical protein [Planctomycetaceae bacterium]